MRAFGSDRVRAGNGGQWILFCRRSKNWMPRVPKTLTTAEHPGTAVLCEEQFYEVVAAEPIAAGGVRYILEPWSDHHIIRVSEPYDEPSEAQREVAYRAAVAREKGRKSANVLGVFTGLLPASVQEQLGSELGILPTKLTSLSLILALAYLIWFGQSFTQRIFDSKPMSPLFLIIAVYLVFESVIRLQIVWFHRRPIASLFGFVPYLMFWLIFGRATGAKSPFDVPRGQKLYITQPTDDVALRDAYNVREPFLTLLSPAEQDALAKRFGFNYRKHAFIVAWVILASAAVGVASSLGKLQAGPRLSAVISLIVALAFGVEQLLRLPALRRGPVPSMLAVLVRPFARKLLR